MSSLEHFLTRMASLIADRGGNAAMRVSRRGFIGALSLFTVAAGSSMKARTYFDCCYGLPECTTCQGSGCPAGCSDCTDCGCPSGGSCWLSGSCLGECCDCSCDDGDCICYIGDHES